MFNGFTWGILLIVLGVSIIVKIIFGISLPLFRIALATTLIVLGLSLITNIRLKKDTKKQTYSFMNITLTENEIKPEYNVLFGSAYIDLQNVSLPNFTKTKINVVFGSTTVHLTPYVPARIKITSCFASTDLPDNTQIFCGSYTYKNELAETEMPLLDIEANVLFGELRVKNR